MLNEIKLAFIENKWAIISATAILLVSMILGYFLEPSLYDFFNPVAEELSQKVETGVIKLTFLSIFSNNIKVVLMMFALGLVLCVSGIILAYNGFFTGYYVATCKDLYYSLLLIIPHGIFEFSSCIIACASGFVLFHFVIRFIKSLRRRQEDSFRGILSAAYDESYPKLKQALILLVVASVLMAIAGFVEVYLTAPFADWVISF